MRTYPLSLGAHESVLKSCLLLQKSVLNELVDKSKHNGVGGSLDGGGGTRGEGEEDAGREEEEEDGSCQEIPHLFVLLCENLLEHHQEFVVQNIHKDEHGINEDHLPAKGFHVVL